jgi:cell division septum initiation protein DivIVA
VISGFAVNIIRAVEMLASEILDLAVYNANRKTKVSRVWEQFTQDLEKMEDNNG